MQESHFASFLVAIDRLLFKRRTVAPPANEVATWRIGNAVIRLDDGNSWWMKLAPGNTLAKIWPQSGDAAQTLYAPSVPANWDAPQPTNVAEALDQLADRVRAIETSGVSSNPILTFGFVNPAVAIGDAVYISGPDTVDRADATSVATAPVRGFVVAIPAPGTATVKYAAEVVIPGGGLVPGDTYYLGLAAPGGITNDPSAYVGGNVVQELGYARNATTLVVMLDGDYTEL